jgi:hypothetical protein
MSKRLMNFLDRYPNMFDEYRKFAVDTVLDHPDVYKWVARRRRNRKASAQKS